MCESGAVRTLVLVTLAITALAVAGRARAQGTGIDTGVDAGIDAGPDAGPDAGSDAGTTPDDAGVPDAGAGASTTLDAALDPADAAATSDAGVGVAAEGAHPETPAAGAATASTSDVIRTLLGLVFLMVLAYVGGHPRVRKLEERIGIAQVMTSGLPYVFLGLLAQQPALDVLNEGTLRSLLPLLQFGLGWIGFQTGFAFEAGALDKVERGTGTVVILLSTFPFVVISGASALLLWAVGLGPDPLALARDACLLGLAGALSAPTLERVVGQRMNAAALQLAKAIALLDDALGVVALACLAAFLHVGATASHDHWKLPGVGWIFVTFGMAVSIGLVVYVVLRGTDSEGEKTSLLLGSVALTAGLAGYLSLSPLVICFFAGMLLRNLPGDDKHQLEATFQRLERPIYLLFLVVVGALWRIDDWRGWVLLPVFVIARFVGRYAGARTARSLPDRELPDSLAHTDDYDLVTPPMGQLALAFVVTAQTLYESPAIQAVVTAMLGGAVLLEVVVQISSRRSRPATKTPSAEVALAPADATTVDPGPAPADATTVDPGLAPADATAETPPTTTTEEEPG